MRITALKKWWTLRVTLFVAALAIAAAVTPVLADSVYPTRNANWSCVDWGALTPGALAGNNYCMTDNSRLYWASDGSLANAAVSLIDVILERQYEPTDLLVNKETPPVFDGSGQTDIIYGQRSDVPGIALAVTWCDDAFDSQRCDQHYVMFKTGPIAASTICHETGHAVGLVHANEMSPPLEFNSPKLGCMQSGVANVPETLSSEMQAEINRVY